MGRRKEIGLPRKRATALEVLGDMDLTGRHFMITGCNQGIGFETARAIALHNGTVTMACRNLHAANSAKERILKEELQPGASIDILHLDLADFHSIEQCAMAYIRTGRPLHSLVLNAGVLNPLKRVTPAGFEATFQINHLAQFYLTKLLMETILRSAPSRVVVVSSNAQQCMVARAALAKGKRSQGINARGSLRTGWELICIPLGQVERVTAAGFKTTFQINHLAQLYLTKQQVITIIWLHRGLKLPDITWERFSPTQAAQLNGAFSAYALSKLANAMFAAELHRRYSPHGVDVYSLHPGTVDTELAVTAGYFVTLLKFCAMPFYRSEEQGAATSVFCAASARLPESWGGGLLDDCRLASATPPARSRAQCDRLWELSEEMLDYYAATVRKREHAKAVMLNSLTSLQSSTATDGS